jgi:hypothetical protein
MMVDKDRVIFAQRNFAPAAGVTARQRDEKGKALVVIEG